MKNYKNYTKQFLLALSFMPGVCMGQGTVLFKTTQQDTIPYRIPAITETTDGNLIALSDYRFCKNDIGFGRVDIHSRISTDCGKTWGGENTVVKGTGIANTLDCGFGDAALVADRESNEVLLVTGCGDKVYWKETTTRKSPFPIAVLRSYDGGETWTQFKDITENLYSLFDNSKLGAVDAMFFGSGRICQSKLIKKGKYYRIYAALCARPGGNRVIYSDDLGRTWNALGDINESPAPKGDEPKCEELPDGRVLLSSRMKGGRYFNIYAYTDVETGSGSWGEVAVSDANNRGTIAVDNATDGEIIIVNAIRKSDKRQVKLALQSVPFGEGRKRVGIYYKTMDNLPTGYTPKQFAENWDGSFLVSNLDSAYSTMIQQHDGSIAFLYEELTYGAAYSIVFRNLSIEEITKGEYSACN